MTKKIIFSILCISVVYGVYTSILVRNGIPFLRTIPIVATLQDFVRPTTYTINDNSLILYPHGGEVFHFGDEITIRWKPQKQRDTSMYLALSNGVVIGRGIDPSAGFYTWKIPEIGKATCSGFSDGIYFCKPEEFDNPVYIEAHIYTPKDASFSLGLQGAIRPNYLITSTSSSFSIKSGD